MVVKIVFEVEDGMTDEQVYEVASRALNAVDGYGPPEVSCLNVPTNPDAAPTWRAIIPREARVHLGMHDGTTLCGIPLATLHPARWSRYAMHVDCPDCESC